MNHFVTIIVILIIVLIIWLFIKDNKEHMSNNPIATPTTNYTYTISAGETYPMPDRMKLQSGNKLSDNIMITFTNDSIVNVSQTY